MKEVLENLEPEEREEVERIILERIEKLALRIRVLRDRMEMMEEEEKEIRERLIGLVTGFGPYPIKTSKVKVEVVELPPRKLVDPKKFLDLLNEMTSDAELTFRILAGCMEINYNEAYNLLRIHFGDVATIKLTQIAVEKSQGPRLLVDLLSPSPKEKEVKNE